MTTEPRTGVEIEDLTVDVFPSWSRAWGHTIHIRVRWTDEKRTDPIPWELLQKVKNETVGYGVWAIEVYPPQDRVVDSIPMRHLWVPVDQSIKFPDIYFKH